MENVLFADVLCKILCPHQTYNATDGHRQLIIGAHQMIVFLYGLFMGI